MTSFQPNQVFKHQGVTPCWVPTVVYGIPDQAADYFVAAGWGEIVDQEPDLMVDDVPVPDTYGTGHQVTPDSARHAHKAT